MARYKLRNFNDRPKYWVGGVIGAGASLLGSIINGFSSANAADEQARAIREQIASNERLQKEMIQFNKEQNAERNSIFRTMNQNMLMQQGRQNVNNRLEGARIQVKTGGKVSNKRFSLRGMNRKLYATDGGQLIPVGYDSNGNPLYTAVGDRHEDVHIMPDGSLATGIGLNNGAEVENGETISNNYVYSNMPELGDGVNSPADMTRMGINTNLVKKIQEENKKGTKSPVRRLRNAGRVRKEDGGYFSRNYGYIPLNGIGFNPTDDWNSIGENMTPNYTLGVNTTLPNVNIPQYQYTSNNNNNSDNFWTSNPEYIGAGIGAAANLIGAGITSLANNYSARRLAAAQRSFRPIDLNIISREDYQAPLAVAALQDPYVNVNPQVTAINRSADRARRMTLRNTNSSAATLSRINDIETNRVGLTGEQYSNAQNEVNRINQENANRLTTISAQNAQNRAQALRDYTNARLDLMKYNNEGLYNSRVNAAQTLADADVSNASTLAAGLQGSAAGINNAINAVSNRNNMIDLALIGATDDAALNYLLGGRRNGYRAALGIYNRYINGNDEQKRLAMRLRNIYGLNV